MLFYKIFKFCKLNFLAVWLDMLRNLLLSVVFIILGHVVCEDYLTDATQRGLDYVRQIGIPFLEKEIKLITIPDFSGSTKTPLSDFVYKLSSIKVVDLQIKTSNLTIDQKNGLCLSFQKIEFDVATKWSYREKNWPHIKDSGDVNIKGRECSLQVIVSLDVHDELHPSVNTKICMLKIGNLKLHFNGKASWLYNFFSSKIANDLRNLVAEEVCSAIKKTIDKAGDKILSQAPDMIKTIKAHIVNSQKTAGEFS